ncbi:MerR family DNA-binding transcriptional regulator [Paenibacillus ginsengarvi]|nr:MerR family transcriptional regulator [Paenibacillus ginsengarvi]
MEQAMTIQRFSHRTGLPASTLRYYEKEGLIEPHVRGDNGYRFYTEEQIPIALTIHSLRLADVCLRDIREYLRCANAGRAAWLRKWREEIDAKLASLRIARQYLHGIEADEQSVRLVKWEAPVPFLWFPVTIKRQLHPYAEAIQETATAYYRRFGVRPTEAFVRTTSADRLTMNGSIGYRLSKGQEAEVSTDPTAVFLEHDPVLFVTLECLASDAFVCFDLMLLLQKFGFEPAGPKLERYNLKDLNHYQWMIPVLHTQSQCTRSGV